MTIQSFVANSMFTVFVLMIIVGIAAKYCEDSDKYKVHNLIQYVLRILIFVIALCLIISVVLMWNHDLGQRKLDSFFGANNSSESLLGHVDTNQEDVKVSEGQPRSQENYPEVTIGQQIWMAKNLEVDRFQNGDPILQVTSDDEWRSAKENFQPAWCYYNFDPSYGMTYGKLYNWYAVSDPRGLAPKGWRVPSDLDWSQLIDRLGGERLAFDAMKSTKGWADGSGTNSSDFSGLPAGFVGTIVGFGDEGTFGGWWSSSESTSERSEAWYRAIVVESPLVGDKVLRDLWDKNTYISVRCVRDREIDFEGAEEELGSLKLEVMGSNVNVRSRPAKNASVLFQLNKGDICDNMEKGELATLNGVTDNWYKIEYEGRQGWVFGQFLRGL